LLTQPGVPLIYYGDEIGMPGAGDPDNRRAYDLERNSARQPQTMGRGQRKVSQDAYLRVEDFLRGTSLDVTVKDPANPGEPESYRLVVPAMTAPGTKFRLPRETLFGGGFVEIRVRALPGFRFKVSGSNLRLDLRISAERATHGLRALPVVEKHGMIWVGPKPDMRLDIDGLLDGAANDLAAYGLDAYHHYETRVLRREMNWKLAIDTFCETYHLAYLHPDTVSPLFHNNRATFAAFGRNHRMIAARRTIDEMRDQPEDGWDLFQHTAIVYVLFPNTIFLFQRDHVETWHIFPGERVDSCSMYVSLYIPEPIASDSAKRHWDNNFNLLMATVEYQDFPTCEGMQRGFPSGAQDAIVFGRNEPALQHFHRGVVEALAAPRRQMAAE
jgi:phenylpropionate dioxygenase-like ring-hydroxylating dioxygenase large terminal subunit